MQLTDFSGHNNAWMNYLTFRNIHSSIWSKYSYHGPIVPGFLPVPPKFEWNSSSDVRAQRVTI